MKKFYLVYDEAVDAVVPEATDTQSDDASNQAAAQAAKAAQDAAAAQAAAQAKAAKFTQEDLNRVLAEEKRKNQDKINKHVTELQALKESKNLTEKEKTDLQERIENLQRDSMTKEQLAIKDRDKIKQDLTQKLTASQQETESWRNRFINQTVLRAITDAAAQAEAFNPEQIIALLQPQTKVVDELDSESKPTGNYLPKVKLQDVGSDGKPVTLDLSVPDAIKRMKDMPEKYGNLFKSTANGGLGMQQGNRSHGKRVQDMDVAEYAKHRAANKGK